MKFIFLISYCLCYPLPALPNLNTAAKAPIFEFELPEELLRIAGRSRISDSDATTTTMSSISNIMGTSSAHNPAIQHFHPPIQQHFNPPAAGHFNPPIQMRPGQLNQGDISTVLSGAPHSSNDNAASVISDITEDTAFTFDPNSILINAARINIDANSRAPRKIEKFNKIPI